MASHILLAAHLTILHWRDPKTQNIAEVIQTIHTHGTYKKLCSSSTGNYKKMNQKWKSWFEWYTRETIL